MNEITTLKRTETLEVFLIGFESNVFRKFTPPPSKDANFYFFNQFNNASSALAQLTECCAPHSESKLPYAILCHYQVLKKDNFQLIQQIHQNPRLREVPFVLFSEQPVDEQAHQLLQMGIDDCYINEVSWQDLSKRLGFLAKFKANMLHTPIN
ncbi:MAG: hypothetical protein AAFP19_17950, partial [Bacteroidota bacterium]